MQSIILAAGMGKRLKDLTQNNTKCMIKVNGVTLIERMLRQLDEYSFSRIIIVVGYEGQKLKDFVNTLNVNTEIVFIDNPVYYKTNNIYSLFLAKEYMVKEDTILLESDLIFEDSVLRDLIEDERNTLALVDKYESWMDGTCIKIGDDDEIEAFIAGLKLQFEDTDEYYKTVNIYKFDQDFSKTHYIPFLDAYIKAIGENEYYEQVLKVITMLEDQVIKAKRLNNQRWYEIDDIQDLDIASSIFAEDEKRIELISKRYGGYWRYPKLLDFCYLINPYYPPKRLIEEIKASFSTLLTQYPSGIEVNSLLAAKNFAVKKEHIVIGNGAAELIKSLMDSVNGLVGVIRPSFEEYANRLSGDRIVEYRSKKTDFSYSVDDIIDFYGRHHADYIILINPDNPSGNYICKNDVIRLAEWCGKQGICLILDESFVDFADEEDSSLINEDVINKYRSLIIIKSISKCYGIPGLRLGVLVSANENLITKIKTDVSIWNINSFAEFYMQIFEKYKKDYSSARNLFRKSRQRMYNKLIMFKQLRVIPSQANYFIIEISGISAKELTRRLYVEYNILIKDISFKMPEPNNNYVRISIRNDADNDKLISALADIFE